MSPTELPQLLETNRLCRRNGRHRGGLNDGDRERVLTCMTDAWLSTLYGSQDEVREGVEEWFDQDALPILVPSSTSGGQMHAIQELFDCFA